jgi:hypothetical protein
LGVDCDVCFILARECVRGAEGNLTKNHRATDRAIGMAIRCISGHSDALFAVWISLAFG